MKKTTYFISHYNYQYNGVEEATNEVVEKRDEFLSENIDNIARIDNENIIYTKFNNGHMTATLILSYYEKE